MWYLSFIPSLMTKTKQIEVLDKVIAIVEHDDDDFICLNRGLAGKNRQSDQQQHNRSVFHQRIPCMKCETEQSFPIR